MMMIVLSSEEMKGTEIILLYTVRSVAAADRHL